MTDPIAVSSGWGERTSRDLSSLLVELSRLVKAISFYAEGDPTRAALLDRAFSAWKNELERAGAVEFVRHGRTLRHPDHEEILESSMMDELVRALMLAGVERLRISTDLDARSFGSFAKLLADVAAEDEETNESFATRLYAHTQPCIEINGERRAVDPLMNTSYAPAASLGSALLGPNTRVVSPEAYRTESADRERIQSPGDSHTVPLEYERDLAPPPLADGAAPAEPTRPTPDQARAKSGPPAPSITDDPLAAPARHPGGERLRRSLQDLDRCTDDTVYQALVGRVSDWASELSEHRQNEETYRAMLVLADQAAGQSGNSGAQARMAQSALEKITTLARLDELIERACEMGSDAVRASQILLQLGERAVPALLDHLEKEADPRRAKQLNAILITLGEHAVPTLLRAIARPSGRRALLAVRLAGEIQSPKLVPTLYGVLKDSGPALRREAAKALVHIGNSEATEILIKALGSTADDLPRLAALSLGMLADERAVRPLLRLLDHALKKRDGRLTEAVIRSLGQLESRRSEICDKLEGVLAQRSIVRRRKQRGAKIASIEVLASFGSKRSHRILLGARRDPDPTVSERTLAVLTELGIT